jgi:hypothetical protein
MQGQTVRFQATLTWEAEIENDPEGYDGATTLAECVEKERLWLQGDDKVDGDGQGDGAYLIEGIACQPVRVSVTARCL